MTRLLNFAGFDICFLENFCGVFQISMIDAIPTLINAIKMIYSISHYYNTSEKITSLFVKVGEYRKVHSHLNFFANSQFFLQLNSTILAQSNICVSCNFLKQLNSTIEIELSLCERLILANHEALFLKVIIINKHCVILYRKNGKRFFLKFLTYVF